MPTPEPTGKDALVDRIARSFNEPTEEPKREPTEEPKREPTKDPTPGPTLDDLNPEEPSKKVDPDEGAPLSDLPNLDEPEPTQEPESEDAPEEGDNFLETFSPEDQEKIQKILDDKLAETLTEGTTAANAFKRLRGENRELSAKLKQASSVTPEELTQQQERIAELQKALDEKEAASSVVRLEDTDAWKAKVADPLGRILTESDAIAERYQADPDQLANILEISDPKKLSEKVNEVLGDEAAEADKMELYALAKSVKKVYATRDELHQNADAALKEAQELALQKEQKQALENKKARVEYFDKTLSRVKDRAGFVHDIIADQEDDIRKKIEETPVADMSEEDIAFSRYASFAFVPMAKKIKALEQELTDLSQELGDRKKASPSPSTANPTKPEENVRGLSFAERAARAINGQ